MAEVDARKLLAQAKNLSARYARRLGPEEAADLVSEALTRGLERPPADGHMDPWLERIARNLLVDRWRRAQVAARAPVATAEDLELAGACPTPEELLLAGERRKIVRRSLGRLPREQRRSILRRYYAEGAAATAGPAATTLRTRLHRGLARLRQLTRGLLALPPPLRLLRALPLALNPAAAVVFMLAVQQTPLPVTAAPAAPAAQRRSHAREATPPPPLPPPSAPAAPPAVVVKARPGRPAPGPSPAPAAAPVVYDFDDDQVEGEILNPDDMLVYGRTKLPHSSLIEIPGSFVAAVVKSVEDL